MASEIRVNTINNRSGLGTISINDSGASFSGVVTATGGFSGNVTGNVTGTVNSSGIATFSSGPVIIGSGTSTGTASQRLQVTGGAYVSGSLGVGVTATNNGVLHVKSNGTNSQSGFAVESLSNDSFLSITNSGTVHVFNATYNSTGSYQPISFTTSGSERLRITAGGNIGIGVTSPGGLLEIASASANPSLLRLYNAINSSTSWGVDFYRDAGAGNNVLRAEVKAVREGNDATSLKFSTTNTSATLSERARIDYDGRLLVGATSSDWTRPRVVIVGNPNETTTGAGVLYLQKANGTVSAGDKIGEIAFSTSSSNVGVYSEIICEGDATGGSADFPGRLVFKTCTDGGSSTVERLRITSSGGVVFWNSNTTGVVNNFAHGGYGSGGSANTNSTTLSDQRCGWFMRSDMQNTNNELGNSILLLQDPGGAAVNPGDIIKGYRGSTFVFRVANDGSLRNSTGSYAAISDERLKQDIVDAPSQWDDIKAVKFKKFKLKDDVERSTEHPEIGEAPYMLGVIAQEIEQVSPGLIDVAKLDDGTPDPDSIKSVKYSILYMKAVKALQEAMERIEVLEEKVNTLENKI